MYVSRNRVDVPFYRKYDTLPSLRQYRQDSVSSNFPTFPAQSPRKATRLLSYLTFIAVDDSGNARSERQAMLREDVTRS